MCILFEWGTRQFIAITVLPTESRSRLVWVGLILIFASCIQRFPKTLWMLWKIICNRSCLHLHLLQLFQALMPIRRTVSDQMKAWTHFESLCKNSGTLLAGSIRTWYSWPFFWHVFYSWNWTFSDLVLKFGSYRWPACCFLVIFYYRKKCFLCLCLVFFSHFLC